MNPVPPILLWLLFLVILPIGLVILLPKFLTPIQIQTESRLSKRVKVLLICLTSFVVIFFALTALHALAIVNGAGFDTDNNIGDWSWRGQTGLDLSRNEPIDYHHHATEVILEVWGRLLLPPSVRQTCYSNHAIICDLADEAKEIYYPTPRDGSSSYVHYAEVYNRILFAGLIAALSSGGLFLYYQYLWRKEISI